MGSELSPRRTETEMGQGSQAKPGDTASRASFRKHMETQAGVKAYRWADLQSTVRHPRWGQMGRVCQDGKPSGPHGVNVILE